MRIIAKKGRNNAICEVSHSELEKFLGLYYGHLPSFTEGEEIDLAKGYDHHSEILSALDKTEKFIKGNGDIIKAITNGILIAAKTGETVDEDKTE